MSADHAWVAQAVAEFGRSLGLDGWGLGDRGQAVLRMASGTLVVLTLADEDLVLRIEQPLGFDGAAVLERALRAAHARHGRAIQLGLRGQGVDARLQVARRLHWREVSASALMRQLEALLEFGDLVRRDDPAPASAASSARSASALAADWMRSGALR